MVLESQCIHVWFHIKHQAFGYVSSLQWLMIVHGMWVLIIYACVSRKVSNGWALSFVNMMRVAMVYFKSHTIWVDMKVIHLYLIVVVGVVAMMMKCNIILIGLVSPSNLFPYNPTPHSIHSFLFLRIYIWSEIHELSYNLIVFFGIHASIFHADHVVRKIKIRRRVGH
jgi:hypothetical protein